MKSSSLFRAMAVIMSSRPLRFAQDPGSVATASPDWSGSAFKTTRSRNGSKPSGAARLKRTAKTRRMAKARRSKR